MVSWWFTGSYPFWRCVCCSLWRQTLDHSCPAPSKVLEWHIRCFRRVDTDAHLHCCLILPDFASSDVPFERLVYSNHSHFLAFCATTTMPQAIKSVTELSLKSRQETMQSWGVGLQRLNSTARVIADWVGAIVAIDAGFRSVLGGLQSRALLVTIQVATVIPLVARLELF